MGRITRVYFGHHKCASQYIKTILRQSAILMGWSVKVDGLASQLPMAYHLHEPFAGRILARQEMLASSDFDLICLENADNHAVAILDAHRQYRGFHVIRDPRDIVVSGYFSHRYSHPVSEHESPWLWPYRQHLDSLPDQESGLLAEIDFCSTYLTMLYDWNYRHPNILEVRYESLIADPLAVFLQIYRFLNIPADSFALLAMAPLLQHFTLHKLLGRPMPKRTVLPQVALRILLWCHSFRRKSGGRRRGDENIRHHYRKGVAGDWRNYFTPRMKAAFKQQYPGLLQKLGYETDDRW